MDTRHRAGSVAVAGSNPASSTVSRSLTLVRPRILRSVRTHTELCGGRPRIRGTSSTPVATEEQADRDNERGRRRTAPTLEACSRPQWAFVRPTSAVRLDGGVGSRDVDQLAGALRRASNGSSDAEYAAVLERALAACASDPVVADELDELDLHSELADVYDRMGRVERALEQVEVLVERGYRCAPDPRCRRAEILMRHGRVSEAAPIWSEVLDEFPDDIWVFNNAGLEYGAIGKHEVALDWLTRGLELALRTGDPERLVPQLRRLRADSLGALGREPDELQLAEPVGRPAPPPGLRAVPPPVLPEGSPGNRGTEVSIGYAWLPAEEFAAIEERWPDIAAQDSVRDGGGALIDHAEYCRRFERTLRETSDTGLRRLRIATLRREAFDAWVAASGRDGEDEATLRAGYAADLTRRGIEVVAWPPGRNERCWCGSGVKYKRCCAAPGRL
jgi:tetratricopeptide (TPR) repeat protein